MWFRQAQVFQLSDSIICDPDKFAGQLEPLLYSPCSPSMPFTSGWHTLLDEEDSPLFRMVNGCILFCLQTEEKIIPASVVQQELAKKVKQIEAVEQRKIRSKQKFYLKDEVIQALMLRAFSKLSRTYAYIDTRHQWLILGTSNERRTEQFNSLFKKSFEIDLVRLEVKNLSYYLTQWLVDQNFPNSFDIAKTCALEDSQQKNRKIRCQQQNLFASSIQSLLQDGCQVKQLGLNWHDRINFVLSDQMVLSGIKFQDELLEQAKELEPETKQQQFDADFLIMTETISTLLKDLLEAFAPVLETA